MDRKQLTGSMSQRIQKQRPNLKTSSAKSGKKDKGNSHLLKNSLRKPPCFASPSLGRTGRRNEENCKARKSQTATEMERPFSFYRSLTSVLAHGGVATLNAVLGEDDLPKLHLAGSRGTGTGEEIILPHSIKPFVIFLFQLRPCIIKILEPRHKCLVVISTEVVHVFYKKESFNRLPYLRN